jgi:hypothetical protein
MPTPKSALASLLAGSLCLAGCASENWVGTMSPEATDEIRSAIDSGPIRATAISADRGWYSVPKDRLTEELGELRRALAAAPDQAPWFLSPDETTAPSVHVVMTPETEVSVRERPHSLRFASSSGLVSVLRQRTTDGWVYRMDLQDRQDWTRHSLATLRGTEELDRAWDDLVRAADAVAIPVEPRPSAPGDVIIDIRSAATPGE